MVQPSAAVILYRRLCLSGRGSQRTTYSLEKTCSGTKRSREYGVAYDRAVKPLSQHEPVAHNLYVSGNHAIKHRLPGARPAFLKFSI
jgi:hypothetical protein